MTRSVREALLGVREWSGVVGRPSRRCGIGQEAHPEVREWSGGPPGGLRVVGRPSRRSRSGGRPSRKSGSGWEALPEVQNWSRRYGSSRESLLGGPGVIGSG